jgi:outer membrane protein TolC
MKRTTGTVLLLCIAANVTFAQKLLTLQQCKEMALKNSAEVNNAEILVRQAVEQKKEAFTNYFPSIGITGLGFTANKPIIQMDLDITAQMQPLMSLFTPVITWAIMNGAPVDPAALAGLQNREPMKIKALKNGLTGGITATQPLFAGGQIVTGNRLAKAGIEVRELQKQITGNEILLETERYFRQLVSLREKMKTIDRSETMLARIQSDVTVSVDAGLTTRNDLTRVELERNRLAGNRSKIENALTTLKLTLAHYIGIPSDSFDIQPPPFDEIILPPPPVGEPEHHHYLPGRPEYRLLQKSVDIAKMQITMETGKTLPSVAIGAGYQYMNFDRHTTGNGMRNNFGMLFATVSVPITDWWGGSHAIKRKKLERLSAENTRRNNTGLLLIQIQQILNELNEAYTQVQLSQKTISLAEENLRISNDNYTAGITTLSDLLEAQTLLQQSRDQHIESLTQYYIKSAEWKHVSATE